MKSHCKNGGMYWSIRVRAQCMNLRSELCKWIWREFQLENKTIKQINNSHNDDDNNNNKKRKQNKNKHKKNIVQWLTISRETNSTQLWHCFTPPHATAKPARHPKKSSILIIIISLYKLKNTLFYNEKKVFIDVLNPSEQWKTWCRHFSYTDTCPSL